MRPESDEIDKLRSEVRALRRGVYVGAGLVLLAGLVGAKTAMQVYEADRFELLERDGSQAILQHTAKGPMLVFSHGDKVATYSAEGLDWPDMELSEVLPLVDPSHVVVSSGFATGVEVNCRSGYRMRTRLINSMVALHVPNDSQCWANLKGGTPLKFPIRADTTYLCDLESSAPLCRSVVNTPPETTPPDRP